MTRIITWYKYILYSFTVALNKVSQNCKRGQSLKQKEKIIKLQLKTKKVLHDGKVKITFKFADESNKLSTESKLI